MGGEACHEVAAVEAFLEHLAQQEQAVGHAAFEEMVHQPEVILLVQDVEVLADALVGQVASGEADHLVEDGEGVAHASVSFLCDECERLGLGRVAFLLCHVHEVLHGVLRRHALEVVHLASAQDGGQYLVLLGGGEDEDDVGGRLLQGLEEGIEGGTGEHVHLVDDEHLVAARLRRDEHLLAELADVLHGVVAGSIELVDVHGPLLVEGQTALALAAGVAAVLRIEAVDGLGKDTRTGGLAHTARTAEEIGMGQLAAADGILQRSGQRTLADDGVERKRAIFKGRNDVFFHIQCLFCAKLQKK